MMIIPEDSISWAPPKEPPPWDPDSASSSNLSPEKLQIISRLQALQSLNFSNAGATFVQGAKIFENHLNPVMLVFIGWLSLSTVR